MLYFTILARDMMIDAGKWTDLTVDAARVFANDRRAANHAIDDFGAFLDRNSPADFTVPVNITLYLVL